MRISDWSSDVCSSDRNTRQFGQERGRWRYAIRHISRLWRMAVPRRSGNASGAGRYSGQAIATTPGSAYRCITKGGDQGPAVSGQHDRPGVLRYDHLRDVIRRAAMPATGLHGQLVHAGVLPCAALAVLLALAGSALYADRLERGFDARGHAMAEQLALGLSDRKSTRLNSSH